MKRHIYSKYLLTRLRTLLPVLAVVICSVTASAQAPSRVSVKASLDSAYILMGRVTPLTLEIIEPESAQGALLLPPDTLVTGVEVAGVLPSDTADLGNSLRQIRHTIVLQSFDSGLYVIPPFRYIPAPGADTVLSNHLTLKVVPVAVDSLATIHDYSDIAPAPSRWYDFLPDFVTDYWGWILIAIIIIAGGIAAWLILSKKVSVPLMPKEKPLSPYEVAISRLTQLKADQLCENGREKDYYTRLTDILRQYLESRFAINAMEMTSAQIMRSLRDNPDTRDSSSLMKDILEIADFVKFAKVRPLPDDNVRSFNRALTFVEDTKPAPEPEPADEGNSEDTDAPAPDKKGGRS
ncbi:MAG: cell wall anchor protein [Muribaculaceae bacterium]|nr:cell wall anchor protein [Muribaculaceae bacterium]